MPTDKLTPEWRAARRAYTRVNKDRVNARRAKTRIRNHDEYIVRERAYHEEHREHVNAMARARWAQVPQEKKDAINEKRREREARA